VDNFAPDQPPDCDGIWHVDLRSGESQLIVSLGQLADIVPRTEMVDADHKVNHALYSPSGKRFVFMHRWIGPRGKFSRLYCASSNGAGLRVLLDHRMVSHYAWRDESTLLVWARTPEGGDRYYLLDVLTGARKTCCAGTLDRFGDGHPSFSPDRRWIVTDTYPDRGRMRQLLLCRPAAGQVIKVGAFHSPWRYDGPTRCDLHPRWSADGLRISIDSSHQGIRGTYVIDVSRIVGARG
jgi:Tol biopolymer transport system component